MKSNASAFLVDKGNHRHFMAKEIHEQPEVVGHTLAHYLDMAAERVRAAGEAAVRFRASSTACRSRPAAPPTTPAWSPNTGSSASRGCRSRSMSPRSSATARRRSRRATSRSFVSQSGETADTLATLRYAKEQKQHVAVGRQRADLDHRARKRRGDADAGRPRDRRRLDQGVHLPARGAGLPRDRRRPRARRAVARTTSASWCAR